MKSGHFTLMALLTCIMPWLITLGLAHYNRKDTGHGLSAGVFLYILFSAGLVMMLLLLWYEGKIGPYR
jgi:cytochrome c biogenesis protein CcdA